MGEIREISSNAVSKRMLNRNRHEKQIQTHFAHMIYTDKIARCKCELICYWLQYESITKNSPWYLISHDKGSEVETLKMLFYSS